MDMISYSNGIWVFSFEPPLSVLGRGIIIERRFADGK